MSSKRHPEKFKAEALKQVTDRRHPAAEGVNWLGVSLPTLYEWLKRYSLPEAKQSDFNFVQHCFRHGRHESRSGLRRRIRTASEWPFRRSGD